MAEVGRRYTGTIKRLVRDKGFGFIEIEGGQECFFHRSAVKDETFENLREGQAVSGEYSPAGKGARLEDVRVGV